MADLEPEWRLVKMAGVAFCAVPFSCSCLAISSQSGDKSKNEQHFVPFVFHVQSLPFGARMEISLNGTAFCAVLFSCSGLEI